MSLNYTSYIYRPSSNPPCVSHFPLIATIAISVGLVGFLSEFIQGQLPYRIFDWGDVCANLSLLPLTIGFSWYWWASREGEGREEVEEEGLLRNSS
jgi:hypothetical protein